MFKPHSHDWKKEISKRKPCFLIVLGMLFKNPWSKLSLVQYEIQYGAKFGEKYQKIGNFFFSYFFFEPKEYWDWAFMGLQKGLFTIWSGFQGQFERFGVVFPQVTLKSSLKVCHEGAKSFSMLAGIILFINRLHHCILLVYKCKKIWNKYLDNFLKNLVSFLVEQTVDTTLFLLY